MIINFNVSNFRSIKDRMLLDLTASDSLGCNGTIPYEKYGMNVLPLTGIYGANGSGKSNLIKAILFMKEKVLGKEYWPVTFRFADSHDVPTEFSMLFTDDNGVMYHYGFSLKDVEVVEEWLSAYGPDVAETELFSRVRTDCSGKYEYHLDDTFRNASTDHMDSLDLSLKYFSSKHLVLSYLAERGLNRICVNVYSWFRDRLVVMDFSEEPLIDETMEPVIENNRKMLECLGFDDAFYDEYTLADLSMFGTGFRKLCSVVPILGRDESMKNVTVVADNYGEGIHRMVNQHFLRIFHGNSLHGLNSQIIFATHDTNIMDMDIIRRDEIQFVELDRSTHASILTSCAEYELDPSLSIRESYLEGRFGAVPLIRF